MTNPLLIVFDIYMNATDCRTYHRLLTTVNDLRTTLERLYYLHLNASKGILRFFFGSHCLRPFGVFQRVGLGSHACNVRELINFKGKLLIQLGFSISELICTSDAHGAKVLGLPAALDTTRAIFWAVAASGLAITRPASSRIHVTVWTMNFSQPWIRALLEEVMQRCHERGNQYDLPRQASTGTR